MSWIMKRFFTYTLHLLAVIMLLLVLRNLAPLGVLMCLLSDCVKPVMMEQAYLQAESEQQYRWLLIGMLSVLWVIVAYLQDKILVSVARKPDSWQVKGASKYNVRLSYR
jgi:hypothetical protein